MPQWAMSKQKDAKNWSKISSTNSNHVVETCKLVAPRNVAPLFAFYEVDGGSWAEMMQARLQKYLQSIVLSTSESGAKLVHQFGAGDSESSLEVEVLSLGQVEVGLRLEKAGGKEVAKMSKD